MLDTIDMGVSPETTYLHNLHMKDERLKRVFIIEDNEMHSMMLDYLLSKDESFNITRFKSGEECIQKLNLKPDLIILDYSLPGMDGLETFKQIKKIDPDIPVVVVTENKSNSLATQFLARGAYDYILKEPNAFNRVKNSVEVVFVHLAKKQYLSGMRRTIIVVGAFIFLIVLSSLISYFVFKHY